MKIELQKITVRELTNGYKDNQENGVVGYGGNLDIRPPYQREFVYKDKQRTAVIQSVVKNRPLNVMYWAVKNNGTYEVIDGQQRTISLCQYITNKFSYEGRNFCNIQKDEQEQILNYELSVYICHGSDSEKLEWFKTINIAGEKLNDQELLNAIYSGSWLADAKKHFSKTECVAKNLGEDYVKGSPIRQDYLETVIKWISNGDVQGYMSKHQHDPNANALWIYFQSVIAWVKGTFTTYRKEMKDVDWGTLYNKYKDELFDANKIEAEIEKLEQDEDVKSKSGIYYYILTRDEKYLNIRTFDDRLKLKGYNIQTEKAKNNGVSNCPWCVHEAASNKTKIWPLEEMEADHITPWIEGGKTNLDNLQMLCREHNRRKSCK